MKVNTRVDQGYNVPAICQHPECNTVIHRGQIHICGADPAAGSLPGDGCGLAFCGVHLRGPGQTCDRCAEHTDPYPPKENRPDFPEARLNAPEWAAWREKNPDQVEHARGRHVARMTGRPEPKRPDRGPPPAPPGKPEDPPATPPDRPATPSTPPGQENPPAPPATPPASPQTPPAQPSTPAAPGKPTTDTTPRSTKP